MSNLFEFKVPRVESPVHVDAIQALRFRGALPGAFGFDHAAAVIRELQTRGIEAIELLPLLLPTSWMVNAKATSRTCQRFFLPDAMHDWAELFSLLATPWEDLEEADRVAASSAVARLAKVEGSNLMSVAKVLSLVAPHHVPLMDDSALWFVLGDGEAPKSSDGATGSPEHFRTMMDWFAKTVRENAASLEAMIPLHQLAPLTSHQCLDRILWYCAWGQSIDPARKDRA